MTEKTTKPAPTGKVFQGVLVLAMIGGVTWLVLSHSDDNSTVVKGTHSLTYVVTAELGVDAGVTLTYSDPLSRQVLSDTMKATPWTKSFTGEDPDAAWARISVDNSNNDTPLKCTVIGDGHESLVVKDIPPGKSGSCSVLHF